MSFSHWKGNPSDPSQNLYGLVLEKLGPSLEDLCNLMSPNVRFDEKMTLTVAIQMVRDFFLVSVVNITHIPFL